MTTPDGMGEQRVPVFPAIEHDQAMPIRIVMRGYFSTYFLWDAQHQAELSGQMEAVHAGESRFSIEHRGYVLSSIVASAAFLESMVSELYRDAVDGHASYVAPLGAACLRQMAVLWQKTNGGFGLRSLQKYERLLEFSGARALLQEAHPYEDASLVVRLRNAIIHYQPEDVSASYQPHDFERSLGGRFPDNALMSGSGNPWWPDHALGYGCAAWAHRSVKALADHVVDILGIRPNYQAPREGTGSGKHPGSPSLIGDLADFQARWFEAPLQLAADGLLQFLTGDQAQAEERGADQPNGRARQLGGAAAPTSASVQEPPLASVADRGHPPVWPTPLLFAGQPR